MKTQVLQLEPFDDYISTRDKLDWSKASQVFLVWPDHGTVLNRRLDLVLLKRYSKKIGAQLVLISRDPDVQYYAPRLGMPVYRSIRQAQKNPTRLPRKFRTGSLDRVELLTESETNLQNRQTITQNSFPQPASFQLTLVKDHQFPTLFRLVIFLLGVLAVISMVMIVLPSATVVIESRVQEQEIIIPVRAIPEISSVNYFGEIPAHLTTITVEGRDSIDVTGSTTIPDQPAIGNILFTNLTDDIVTIPSGTVIRTATGKTVQFVVTLPGELPAGAGQTIMLPIRCMTPGVNGNLPAGSLVAIEGMLGTQLTANNPEPTLQGTDRTEPAPGTPDREQLFTRLDANLAASALDQVKEKLSEGDFILISSLNLIRTLEATYQPEHNQPADHLDLRLQQEYQVMVIQSDDLLTLANTLLDARLPEGFSPVDGTLSIENLSDPDSSGDNGYTWSIRAARKIKAAISRQQAAQLIVGLTPNQASEKLEGTLPLQSPPRITISPDWWRRLPWLPFRIEITDTGLDT